MLNRPLCIVPANRINKPMQQRGYQWCALFCWADNQKTHQYGKLLALLKQSRFKEARKCFLLM